MAAELADDVWREVSSWKSFDRWTVGLQIVRAADSIGANIAEALGRGSAADQRRMLFIARGSVLETEHWLDRAATRGLIDKQKIESQLSRLARLVTGLLHSDRLHR